MKKIIPTVAIFLMALLVFAGNPNYPPLPEAEKCRNGLKDPAISLSTVDGIRQDLLSGVWTENHFGSPSKAVLHFQDYGIVDLLIVNNDERTIYNTRSWRVEEASGKIFLILENPAEECTQRFRVEPTCHGMVLTDLVNNEEVHLAYSPKAESKEMAFAKANLKGTWESATSAEELINASQIARNAGKVKDAFMTFEFNTDGTYKAAYGCNSFRLEEQGYYEITQDGKFIIFYASPTGNAEQVIGVKTAEIGYLTMGELVLKVSLNNSEQKTIAFAQ